jgi:16S rRNA (cytosine967-C5)-methyltransferase
VLKEENEDVIERFLADRPDFQGVGPSSLPPALAEVTDPKGFIRCQPHINDTDGFFAARLERKN